MNLRMIEFLFAFSTCTFLSGEPLVLTGIAAAGFCSGVERITTVTTIKVAVKNNDMPFT